MKKTKQHLLTQELNRYMAYFGLNAVSSSSTSISLAFSSFRSISTVFSSFIVNRGRSGSFMSMTIFPIMLMFCSMLFMFSPDSSPLSSSLPGGAPGGNWGIPVECVAPTSLCRVVSSSSCSYNHIVNLFLYHYLH